MNSFLAMYIENALKKIFDVVIYDYDKLDDEDHTNYKMKEGQVLVCVRDRHTIVYDSKEAFLTEVLNGKPIDLGNGQMLKLIAL